MDYRNAKDAQGRTLTKGDRVEVSNEPHKGRQGKITEFFLLRDPQTAMLCLDDGGEHNGNFVVVSLTRLDKV